MFGCWKGKVNDHLNNCQIAQTDKKSCEDLRKKYNFCRRGFHTAESYTNANWGV